MDDGKDKKAQIDRQIDRWMDGWMDRQIDGWIDTKERRERGYTCRAEKRTEIVAR